MFNSLTLTDESADYAITKLRSFVRVNRSRSSDEKEAALGLYCESVGIDESVLINLQLLLLEAFPDDASHVFIGTLIGLAMAEYAVENE